MVNSAWKVDYQPWHLLPRETRSRPESYNKAITKRKKKKRICALTHHFFLSLGMEWIGLEVLLHYLLALLNTRTHRERETLSLTLTLCACRASNNGRWSSARVS